MAIAEKFTELENGRLPQPRQQFYMARLQFTELENGRLPQRTASLR